MRTSRSFLLVPAMLLAYTVAAAAQAPATASPTASARPLTVAPGSRLWVEGTSTVRSFACHAKTFDVAARGSPTAVHDVLAGTKAIESATVILQTRALDCGNGTMNGHMRDAIKARNHPTIQFRMTSYTPVVSGDSVRGTIAGTLSLGGVERPVTLTAVAVPQDSTLHVTGQGDISMHAFGLKPPSLFFGTLRVGDQLRVRFDLLLTQ